MHTTAKHAKDAKELETLERKFWQSMVDEDTDTALSMMAEPSLMVSPHGAMQFDHAAYRKMAEQGSMVILSFELSDFQSYFPTEDLGIVTYKARQVVAPRGKNEGATQQMVDSSTWVRQSGAWRCVAHTETALAS